MTTPWVRLVILCTCAMPLQLHASELQGVWIFQREINTTATGEVVDVPGPAYQGMLIYTPDGYVSANLMPKGRAWQVADATLEQLRQTVGQGSSTGYAGRYEVDTKAKTVTHIPLTSLDPADEGRRLVRNYLLDGNVLKLSGTWSYEGKELRFEVQWSRVGNR